jgi:hypothetical protein
MRGTKMKRREELFLGSGVEKKNCKETFYN